MRNQTVKRSVLHFCRWGNKSFSAFSSLHRVVKVCVLSSAYFVSLGMPALVAQTVENTSKEIDLDEVEVSAENNELAMESDLTRIIAVVSKTDIERSSAGSLAQILESLPGIDVRQRGAHSTQADLSIRASSFEQVLILLNGINISDPQTGHNNLNIPIALSSIERIEILEGAGLRYNTEGAFAGAINIITKKAEQSTAEAETSYGENNYSHAGANIYLKDNAFAHQISLSRTASDGYRYNTDFETQRLYLNSSYKSEDITIDYQLGYINNRYGSNGFYSADYPEQYEQVNSLLSSVKASLGNKVKFSPKAYYKRTFDRFELFRDYKNAASWYSNHNYHQTDVWGGGLDAKHLWTYGTTRAGIDLRHERIRSNKLGEDISPIAHPNEDSIYFTKEKSRTNYNAFANHTLYLDNIVVGVNLLLNYNGISEKAKLYSGIDMAYQLSSKLALKASANESFRMPSYTDLYYTGPNNTGNAGLTQEEASTYDLGINYQSRAFSLQGSLFYRQGRDIIDWVKPSINSDVKWETMNYTSVNTYGYELQASLSPGELWDNLRFIEHVKTSFSYNDSQVEEQNYVSLYALDYLKQKATLSVDIAVLPKLKLNISGQYQKRENPTETNKYEPFSLIDTKLQWEGEYIRPYISISNIMDVSYYDFNHLPQAGRWAIVGIKLKL